MTIRLVLVWGLAGLAFAGSTASGQSLADVARQEQARRKAITTPIKEYTNKDVRPLPQPEPPPSPQPETATAPAQQPAEAAAGADTAATPAAAAPQTTPPASEADVKDEAYWRTLASDAREKLEHSQDILSAFQLQNETLATRFAQTGDSAERARLVADIQRVQAEIDRVQTEIAARTQQLAAIEEQARRAGVPPGWIRPPRP